MSARQVNAVADWDDVWAEYDARNPGQAPHVTPAPMSAPLPARPVIEEAPARPASGARRIGAALAILPLLAAAWFSAPYVTAWQLVQAIDSRDHATMARHLDTSALQGAVRQALQATIAEGHGPQARAYLAGMSAEMTEAWSQPGALAEVARARGVRPGAAGEALSRTLPIGLTRFEMPLGGHVAPMALQIELTSAGLTPRWQVTGVRMEDRAAVPPAPAMRLTGLR
ncbi:DUF2939 domain-containing protein [Roseomonas sp. F4]